MIGRKRQELVIAANGGGQDDGGVRTFVFVAYDDFQLLDLAGPADVLRAATLLGADPPYATVVATPDGRPVRSSSGVEVAADASLAPLRS